MITITDNLDMLKAMLAQNSDAMNAPLREPLKARDYAATQKYSSDFFAQAVGRGARAKSYTAWFTAYQEALTQAGRSDGAIRLLKAQNPNAYAAYLTNSAHMKARKAIAKAISDDIDAHAGLQHRSLKALADMTQAFESALEQHAKLVVSTGNSSGVEALATRAVKFLSILNYATGHVRDAMSALQELSKE